MVYTISDFCHVYEDEVRLIAGWGGMTRKIENVGILDYEMVRDVRNRYLHSNFHPDQIVRCAQNLHFQTVPSLFL